MGSPPSLAYAQFYFLMHELNFVQQKMGNLLSPQKLGMELEHQ